MSGQVPYCAAYCLLCQLGRPAKSELELYENSYLRWVHTLGTNAFCYLKKRKFFFFSYSSSFCSYPFWNDSNLYAGAAYLEVMQQIVAAVQSASQLEVADLIQDRATDGSLPIPATTNEPSINHDAAGDVAAAGAAAAAMVPSSSKRKAVDRDREEVEEAARSQMRNAKRPRVEKGGVEHPQEAQDGQAGPSALNRSKASVAAELPTAADGKAKLPAVGTALPDQDVGTGPLSAGLDTAGTSHTGTAAMGGGSSAAIEDELRQNHGRSSRQAGSGVTLMAEQSQVDGPEGMNTALARDVAAGRAGDAGQEQAGLTASVDQHARGSPRGSPAMPDEEILQSAHLGPSTQIQPGPSTQTQTGSSNQTQPGPSTQTQSGPSTGVPDQDAQEDTDPEMKEKREQARSRSRAWRKVLLDGLDLQTELTAAAAQALHSDSTLGEAEVKVSPSC